MTDDRTAAHGAWPTLGCPTASVGFLGRSRSGSLLVALSLALSACSPLYVIRAGVAEAKILSARRPIPAVILDESTEPRTRDLLTIASEARRFARDSLKLDVGESYTTFTQLEKDTLSMVVTAAYRDRLQARTWWFPVVGHVPYKGFFDFDKAERERQKLEAEGFDTYLRPVSAFSTLGWFPDPLLSTVLHQDDAGLVETIIHELSHNQLFVPGQVRFNESFATFVGYVGAAEFFCRRSGGGSDTVKCARARARWRDVMRFSAFLDPVVDGLQTLYGDTSLDAAQKEAARQRIFEDARTEFRTGTQPTFEASSFSSFLTLPLNNATLLSRMRYYHRLADFQALLTEHGGDLVAAIAELESGAGSAEDPFSLLPVGPVAGG